MNIYSFSFLERQNLRNRHRCHSHHAAASETRETLDRKQPPGPISHLTCLNLSFDVHSQTGKRRNFIGTFDMADAAIKIFGNK